MQLEDIPIPDNIIKKIKAPPVFSNNEKIELMEVITEHIEDFVQGSPLLYSSPYFQDTLNTYLFDVLMLQIEFLFDFDIEEDVHMLIDEGCKIYYSHGHPKRSYCKTFIREPPDIDNISKKLSLIKEKPQPEQRTNEWHEYRHKLITASSAWKALNSEAKKNELIYEKCAPLAYKSYGINTALHWGQKYEPVSVMIYERKYKTNVEDFGCIKHSFTSVFRSIS